MGEVLVRVFRYSVAARYLENSGEMVLECYSYIEAGELGEVAVETLDEINDDLLCFLLMSECRFLISSSRVRL